MDRLKPIKVKHFPAVTPNAGDTMIGIKSRDLIREVIPNSDIITLAAPITEEKIELFGTPDIIVIGGGPLFGSYHLSDFPSSIDIPVYFLGIGTMVKKHEVQKLQYRSDKIVSSLKNIRLASTREYATKDRLERLGIKSRVIGCPVMHLSRERQWLKKTNSERSNDTLIFNYRDDYIPERLLLDESKALDIAKKLGFNKAIIVAHSYEKNMWQRDQIRNPITKSQQQTLRIFQMILSITKAAINKPPLKRYIHPVIHNNLKYMPFNVYTQQPGMKFYDAYAYPLLYQNARFVISYQLHASIMAAAVRTPYLHIFIEESSRVRDMIETYDPELNLHLPANSANFDDVVSKARSILENPDPLLNYNKRVNKAFRQWELFKEEMQNDLQNLGLSV